MKKKNENIFSWNETIQKLTQEELKSFNIIEYNKDLNEYKDTIKSVVDSFLRMCDYIEENENLGCGNCPVYYRCFVHNKHEGLSALMNVLEINKTQR